jgi:hypothetical protein
VGGGMWDNSKPPRGGRILKARDFMAGFFHSFRVFFHPFAKSGTALERIDRSQGAENGIKAQ